MPQLETMSVYQIIALVLCVTAAGLAAMFAAEARGWTHSQSQGAANLAIITALSIWIALAYGICAGLLAFVAAIAGTLLLNIGKILKIARARKQD